MRILITLDDVIRNKSAQIIKVFKKTIKDTFDENTPLTTNNMQEILGMNKSEYNHFLYEEGAFDIFADAPTTENMLGEKMNLWMLSLQNMDYDEPIEVVIGNAKEFNNSLGFSYFFLSKIGAKVREVYFPKDSMELWNCCDVMVTADPLLLENKPDGRKTIKINMEYNKNCVSDYAYDTFGDFMNDNKVIEELFKND